MSTPGKNPEDILRREILADANRQAERLLRKARNDADDLKAAAEQAVEAERQKVIDAAD